MQMTTKDRVLQEALNLFSQYGYEAVSVERIAAAVGIKAPSLYAHFKSKQVLFDAMVQATRDYFWQSYPSLHPLREVKTRCRYQAHLVTKPTKRLL